MRGVRECCSSRHTPGEIRAASATVRWLNSHASSVALVAWMRGPTFLLARPNLIACGSAQRADRGSVMLPADCHVEEVPGQPRGLQPGTCGGHDAEAMGALRGLHQCALAPVGGEICIDTAQVPYDLPSPRLCSRCRAEQAAALAAVIRAELEGERGTANSGPYCDSPLSNDGCSAGRRGQRSLPRAKSIAASSCAATCSRLRLEDGAAAATTRIAARRSTQSSRDSKALAPNVLSRC